MDLSATYASLNGSHANVGLCLSRELVQSISNAAANHMGVQRLEFTLVGPRRFRIRVELANSLFHFFGSLFLRVLAEGIDIQIAESAATTASPTLFGFIDTNLIVGVHVIQQVLVQINNSVGAEVVRYVSYEMLGLVTIRVIVALDPILALQMFVPFGAGHHVNEVTFNVNDSVLFVGVGWRHTGTITKATNAATITKSQNQETSMDMKPFEDLLNRQIANRFADLKGSWANLHIELPEKLLNDAMQSALASQLSPWLSLVSGASVKGNVSVEVKLKA